MKTIAIGAAVLAGIAAAAPAGAFTIFTDRAAFEAVNTVSIETFEAEAIAGPQAGFNFTEFSVFEAGPQDVRVTDAFGNLLPEDGDRFLAYTKEAGVSTVFLFDNFQTTPVTAFGFDIAVDGLLSEVTIGSGPFPDLATFTVNEAGYVFFGISEPDFEFQAIIVTVTPVLGALFPGDPEPDILVGFDNVSLGQVQVVPLPAGLPLLMAGLGLLGLAGLRRG